MKKLILITIVCVFNCTHSLCVPIDTIHRFYLNRTVLSTKNSLFEFSLMRASSIPLYVKKSASFDSETKIKKQKQSFLNTRWKRVLLAASCTFISGSCWGLHEAISHHYDNFQRTFPKANPQFWNPDISWTNKYRNWPEDKRKTSVPVVFTDAKHLLASSNQSLLIMGGVFIAIGEKRPFWHYLLDTGISFAAYSVGNALTYNWLYR